jgi:hypothetical protein
MLGMLICGTANTIVGKYLDMTKAPKNWPNDNVDWPEDQKDKCFPFTHPYIQTFSMFVGEIVVFFALFIK